MKSKIYVGIGGLAATFVVLFLLGSAGSNPTGASVAATDKEYGTVEIPLSGISETANFYTLSVDGVKVKYFAVRGSDGVVRTAFDACDVCGGYKGYQQIGDDMRCINCGRFFNIDDLGTKNSAGGGCWPSYLSHEIVGDNVVIDETEIAASRWRFA
jgi:uncharacterized membrane protein